MSEKQAAREFAARIEARNRLFDEYMERWRQPMASVPMIEDYCKSMTEKQAVSDAAIEAAKQAERACAEVMFFNHCGELDNENSARFAFTNGFDAGFDAGEAFGRAEWIPIRSEADLPKEDGTYLVTMHTPSTDKHVSVLRWFNFVSGIQDESARLRQLRMDKWLPTKDEGNWALAWMPLPEPYTGEKTDDKQ